ncbi:MAG: hypothetical protein KKH97_06660 [Proteobacteria bacterium]|nr:hypothetical protein [Pseudomonadota bacterium]
MGAYANRRNNDLPFVNGDISASMKSGQPQKGFYHEAVYRIRLYNLYCLFGASSKPVTNFLRFAYAPIPKRHIFMTITIMCKASI